MHAPTPESTHDTHRSRRNGTRDGVVVRDVGLPPAPPLDRSERCATVARWFGLDRALRARARDGARPSRRVREDASDAASLPAEGASLAPARAPDAFPSELADLLAPGTVTLVCGPSGSGKSSLLRRLRDAHDLPSVACASRPGIRAERLEAVEPLMHGGGGEGRLGGSSPSVEEPLAAAKARAGRPSHGEGASCRNDEDDRIGREVSAPVRWIDLAAVSPPDVPLVDCFDDAPLRDVLRLLGRVGLGEAWTYLRTPAELSDGQRWRLNLALALHHAGAIPRARPRPGPHTPPVGAGPRACPPPSRERQGQAQGPAPTGASPRTVLVVDEFAALLDRLTARVVARLLRHVVDSGGGALAALVATSHDDLADALAPDVLIRCDFGRVSVRRRG